MTFECERYGEHDLEVPCMDIKKTDIEISDVEFSIRSQNILREQGIRYLNELTRYTTRALLEWRNTGKKCLNEIREKLALHGLSLMDETVDVDIKKTILVDLPKVLREIKIQVDSMQNELRFFGYKIDQIAQYAEKTKRKIELPEAPKEEL